MIYIHHIVHKLSFNNRTNILLTLLIELADLINDVEDINDGENNTPEPEDENDEDESDLDADEENEDEDPALYHHYRRYHSSRYLRRYGLYRTYVRRYFPSYRFRSYIPRYRYRSYHYNHRY